MKVKMFAVMALSSLLISSISFAMPNFQYAEDNTTNTDMNMQSQAPTDNNDNMQSQSNVGSMGGSSNSMDNNNNNNSNNNASTDDMSADTATGDDDY